MNQYLLEVKEREELLERKDAKETQSFALSSLAVT